MSGSLAAAERASRTIGDTAEQTSMVRAPQLRILWTCTSDELAG